MALPAAVDAGQLPTAPLRTWAEVVLDIFPDNIAKSVADGDDPAGGGVQRVLRHRARHAARCAAPSDAGVCREPRRHDVRLHRHRHVLAPIGVGAAIAYTVGHLGVGVLVNLLKLLATFYVAVAVFVGVVLVPIALDRARTARAASPRRGRAGVDRLCHHQFRGGAAARDGGDGAPGRAAADRRVRDADRLQLQPRRQHAVSVADRASSWRRPRASSCRSASSSCCS